MKKVFYIFLTLQMVLTLYLPAQPVTQEWVRRYDGQEHLFDVGIFVQLDNLGNIYVVGSTFSDSSYDNILVIKYNNSGTKLWDAVYNGPGNYNDYPHGMCVDDSGNVYVAGLSAGSGPGTDFVSIKYNNEGNLKWVSRYKGPNDNEGSANSIALDSNGNVCITGSTGIYPTGTDIVTIKYNSQTGDSIWTRRFHETGFWGNYEEIGLAVCADTIGNIYVAGSSYWNHGPPFRDYLLIKYTPAGELEWFKKYNGPSNNEDYINHMGLDRYGNIIVTGLSVDTTNAGDICTIKYNPNGGMKWLSRYNGSKVGGIEIDNSSNVYICGDFSTSPGTDYVTIKYDSSGIRKWFVLYNGTGNSFDNCLGIKLDDSSNVYVTGRSLNSNNGFDFATVKYNNYGVQKWVERYPGGPGNINSTPIAVDNNLNVYITGGNNLAGTNVDVITIKYSQPNGVIPISNNIPAIFSLSQNYPNPFNPITNIKFQIAKLSDVKLMVFDVLCREVATLVNQQLTPGTYEVGFDGSNYPSGVYFYRLTVTDASTPLSITKKMVLLK